MCLHQQYGSTCNSSSNTGTLYLDGVCSKVPLINHSSASSLQREDGVVVCCGFSLERLMLQDLGLKCILEVLVGGIVSTSLHVCTEC